MSTTSLKRKTQKCVLKLLPLGVVTKTGNAKGNGLQMSQKKNFHVPQKAMTSAGFPPF